MSSLFSEITQGRSTFGTLLRVPCVCAGVLPPPACSLQLDAARRCAVPWTESPLQRPFAGREL
eukprot:3641816-Pleurochrysis_carterae.AAC.1